MTLPKEAYFNAVPYYALDIYEAAAYKLFCKQRFDKQALPNVELVAFEYDPAGHARVCIGVTFNDGTRYDG